MADLDDDLGFVPDAPAPSEDDDLGFVPDAPAAEAEPVAAAPAPTPGATGSWDTNPEWHTNAGEKTTLGKAVEYGKGVLEAGQTLGEQFLSLGGNVTTPVAAAESLPGYLVGQVKDAFTGKDETTWSKAMAQTRADIEARAKKFAPTAFVGGLAGNVAASVATGGFGGAAVAAKAAPIVTSSFAKLAPAAVTKIAPLVGVGASLVAEGAVEGAVGAAAKEIDDTIAKGDWGNLGEKLVSAVPTGAYEGAKWNTLLGGGFKLGLAAAEKVAGKFGAEAAEDLTIKVGNSAPLPPPEMTPSVANLYDPEMPLRASELVDNSSDMAKAARAGTTTELARELRNEAVAATEKAGGRMLEIEAALDHKLRKASKSRWTKDLDAPYTGPRVEEVLAEVGITPPMLAELAEKTRNGDGGNKVDTLIKKLKQHSAELPAPPAPAKGGSWSLNEMMAGKRTQPTPARDLTVGEVAYVLDNIKSDIQRVVAKTYKKNGLIHEALYEPAEALKRKLEDPSFLGEFAEAQKPVNMAWSTDIDALGQSQIQSFFDDGRIKADTVGGNANEKIEIFNPKTFGSFLDRVGVDVAEEQTEEALKVRFRAREQSFAERMRWMGETGAEERRMLAEYSTLRRQLENTINTQALANKAAAAYKPVEESLTAGVTGAVVGAGIGTAIGNALGSAGVGGTVGAGVGNMVANRVAKTRQAWKASKVADQAARALPLKRAAALTQKRVNSAAKLDKLIKGVEKVEKAVRPVINVTKAIEAVDALQDPESPESQKLQSQLQKLEDVAGPEAATAFADQLQKRNAFLLEKAGLPPAPTMFGGAPKRQLDDNTLATLARYQDAADDPAGALERLSAGEETAEDTETLATLYPAMLGEWREKAIANLASLKEAPSYDAQLRLTAALGIPVMDDMSPSSLQFFQGVASGSAEVSAEKAAEKQASVTAAGRYKGEGKALAPKSDKVA